MVIRNGQKSQISHPLCDGFRISHPCPNSSQISHPLCLIKKKKQNRGAERARGPPKKVEKPGIDPGASSMLMTRSAI